MNSALANYLENKQKHRLASLLADRQLPEISPTAIMATGKGISQQIRLHPYTGNSTVCREISSVFNKVAHPAVKAALVHGSIATSEEVNFSDFDGIIILDQSNLKTTEDIFSLGRLVSDTFHLMYKQDALQHHGWSFLDIEDFANYPDADLPAELLKYSRLLFPSTAFTADIRINNAVQDYSAPFFKLCGSILKKLQKRSYRKNYYVFKNFCSEILLLPAVYCQAKFRQPVFKRESFALAEKDFSTHDWQPVKTVSQIRTEWDQLSVHRSTEMFIHRWSFIPGIKSLRYEVPDPLKTVFDHDFEIPLQHLISVMHKNIREAE